MQAPWQCLARHWCSGGGPKETLRFDNSEALDGRDVVLSNADLIRTAPRRAAGPVDELSMSNVQTPATQTS
jgi:hypothetical protein